MANDKDDISRMLEDPRVREAARRQQRGLVPVSRPPAPVPATARPLPPAVRTPAQPPALRTPPAQPPARTQPPQRQVQPAQPQPRSPAPRTPARPPTPRTPRGPAPAPREKPGEEGEEAREEARPSTLTTTTREPAHIGVHPHYEEPVLMPPGSVPDLSGGPNRGSEGGRTDRFHCPVCKMMADLSRLDQAPYAVDLWVQVYGGKAGTNVRTDGSVNPTPRGSISYFPAGTAAEAEAISARLVEIAREIIRRAEDGTLVRV